MKLHDQSISRYLRNYKFNSIFVKNFLLIMLLVIVPIIGGITITYYSYDNIQKNDAKASALLESERLANDIGKAIKGVYAEICYISYHPETELFIYPRNNDGSFWRSSVISVLVKMPIVSKNYVTSSFLYSETNSEVASYSGITTLESFENKDSLKSLMEHFDTPEDSIILPSTEIKSGTRKQVLSVCRKIKFGQNYTGLGVINIDLNELVSEINLGNSEIYIAYQGEILYPNKESQIEKAKYVLSENEKADQDGYILSGDQSIVFQNLDIGDLEIISCIDVKNYESLAYIRSFMIIFVAVMVLVTFILCFYILEKLFSPIRIILSAIENGKENEKVQLVKEEELLSGRDEIKYIVSSIEKAAVKNRNISMQLEERIKLLKKAQSIALQSQINPHFFNNTLQTINWKAISLLGRENDISIMSEALSSMLRLALENTDIIVPFSQEVEHANMYLKIQEKRYGDKFQVQWDIPEDVLNCKTIRILLQPIIENSIYHGIKMLSGQGIIKVSARVCDQIVELMVHDNGTGMSPSQVESINEQMQKDMITESRHIGLSNVNQRIKLSFGEEYGVNIQSDMSGTTVTVIFPYIL